jgi:antitoxin MazE
MTDYHSKVKIMILSIIPIGNSRGIRLPKTLLDQCHITNKVEVEVSEEKITLRPIREARKGWDEQMKLMHKRGEDKLILSDSIDSEFEGWEW